MTAVNRTRAFLAAGAVALVALVAVAAFLIGRSGSGEAARPAASPSPTASPSPVVPVDGGTFYVLNQLVAAMPIQCAGLRSPASPPPDRTSGMCTTDEGQVTAVIYRNQVDRNREAEAVGQAFFLKGQTMLVGANWTLFGPDAVIEQCKAKMGGQLVQTPR